MVRCPFWAAASPVAADTVVFPTPPLPDIKIIRGTRVLVGSTGIDITLDSLGNLKNILLTQKSLISKYSWSQNERAFFELPGR